MSRRNLVALAAVVLAASLSPRAMAAPGTATSAAGDAVVTVGDFLLQYAETMRLPLTPRTAEAALAELSERGLVEADADLARVLTEGDVVRIASRSGLRLTSLREDRVFPASKLGPFFDTFGDVLGSPDDGGPSADGGVLTEEVCDPDVSNCGEGSDRAREKRKKKKDRETPPDP